MRTVQYIPRATEKAYTEEAKNTYIFYVPKNASKQEIAKQQKQPKQELPNRFEQYALTGDNLVKFNQKTEKLLVDSALMGQEPSQENTLNQYDVDRGEN